MLELIYLLLSCFLSMYFVYLQKDLKSLFKKTLENKGEIGKRKQKRKRKKIKGKPSQTHSLACLPSPRPNSSHGPGRSAPHFPSLLSSRQPGPTPSFADTPAPRVSLLSLTFLLPPLAVTSKDSAVISVTESSLGNRDFVTFSTKPSAINRSPSTPQLSFASRSPSWAQQPSPLGVWISPKCAVVKPSLVCLSGRAKPLGEIALSSSFFPCLRLVVWWPERRVWELRWALGRRPWPPPRRETPWRPARRRWPSGEIQAVTSRSRGRYTKIPLRGVFLLKSPWDLWELTCSPWHPWKRVLLRRKRILCRLKIKYVFQYLQNCHS